MGVVIDLSWQLEKFSLAEMGKKMSAPAAAAAAALLLQATTQIQPLSDRSKSKD